MTELNSMTGLDEATKVPMVIASILRPEGTTGVHTHVRELCSYLDTNSLPHELVTPFSRSQPLSTAIFGVRLPLQWAAAPVSVAWYRHWHTAFLATALRRRLATLGPAVIYAQGPEAAIASIQARKGTGQRVIMAVHFLRSQAGGWVSKGHITPNGYVAKAIERSEREVVRHLDGIVYVSQAARDEFVAAVPEAAGLPSDIVPNFVRPLTVSPHPGALADLVTIGGLEREKNQQFLLRVLAHAKDAGQTYSLDIYGQGALRRGLEREAARLGIASQVQLRGYDPAVRSRLPGYRAYVHACAVETGPLALIEALAAGLPVMAGNKGGVGELLSDGIEGRYWPLDDPVAASRLLIAFLQDEQALHQASLAALRRFSTSFDANLIAPRLASFLYERPTQSPWIVGPHTQERRT